MNAPLTILGFRCFHCGSDLWSPGLLGNGHVDHRTKQCSGCGAFLYIHEDSPARLLQ